VTACVAGFPAAVHVVFSVSSNRAATLPVPLAVAPFEVDAKLVGIEIVTI